MGYCPEIGVNTQRGHDTEKPEPLYAVGCLTRFGHYDMIPTHQDDVIGIQQVVANQQPVELTPMQARIEHPQSNCARRKPPARSNWPFNSRFREFKMDARAYGIGNAGVACATE
jgi:hypothetical protein